MIHQSFRNIEEDSLFPIINSEYANRYCIKKLASIESVVGVHTSSNCPCPRTVFLRSIHFVFYFEC